MASIVDAQNALIERLMGMPDRPAIAYPSGKVVNDLPRIVVQKLAPTQRTLNLSGDTDSTASILARIEIEDGQGDARSSEILTAIQERFPVGFEAATFWIEDLPASQAEYQAGGVYHVPVIISGRYIF